MRIKYSVAGFLLFLSVSLVAQNNTSSSSSTFKVSAPAPDSSNNGYDHKIKDAFIGLGFVMGPSDFRAKVKYGQSREFIVGTGFGYRFVKWNGIGIDIYYKSTGFFLTQDSNKVLPNNTLHNSEKVSFDNFGGQAFDRFILGQHFFDFGIYFDWAFYTKHIAWDNHTMANSAGGSTTKTIDRTLVFANNTNYGLVARFGHVQGLSLYFSYRLSKVFQSNTYPELPPYVLGVTLGLHN